MSLLDRSLGPVLGYVAGGGPLGFLRWPMAGGVGICIKKKKKNKWVGFLRWPMASGVRKNKLFNWVKKKFN